MVDQKAGELGGVVADDTVFLDKIAGEECDAEAGDFCGIEANLFGAFRAVTAGDFGRDGFAIGDDVVDEILADVLLNRADVFAERVMGGFAWLGHEIGNVDARGVGTSDGTGDLGDQEIREDARVERAGTHEDEVGIVNRFDSGAKWANTTGNEFEFADGNRAAGNFGFTFDAFAIGERSNKMNVGGGGRKDAAADGEDFRGYANGFSEISGDMRERGEEEIPKIVAAQAASSLETILEEAAEEGFVFRKSNHTVANVARWKDAILAAESTGAAAVIGHGDDGGKIGDGARRGGFFVAAADNVVFQAAEERGESGAAAERDDAEGAGSPLRLARFFHWQCGRRASGAKAHSKSSQVRGGLQPPAPRER
jgi:hypothetical protein